MYVSKAANKKNRCSVNICGKQEERKAGDQISPFLEFQRKALLLFSVRMSAVDLRDGFVFPLLVFPCFQQSAFSQNLGVKHGKRI